MAFSLVKHLSRPGCQVVRRYLATSSVRMCSVGPPVDKSNVAPAERPSMILAKDKENVYPTIGNREIVGFGKNSYPEYEDSFQWPHSAVRFRELTGDLVGLRQKETGDWNQLSVDEKKQLYRATYCSTFAEFTAPTGEWKHIWALFFSAIAATGLFMIYLKKFVYLPVRTNTVEWQTESIKQQVARREGPVHGVASNYDYENKRWK